MSRNKNKKNSAYLEELISLLMQNCSGLVYSTNESDLYDILIKLSEVFNVLLYDDAGFFQDVSSQHIVVENPEVFAVEHVSYDTLGIVSMYSMLEESTRAQLDECIEKSALPFVFLDYGSYRRDGDLWKSQEQSLYSQNKKFQFQLNLDTLQIVRQVRNVFF